MFSLPFISFGGAIGGTRFCNFGDFGLHGVAGGVIASGVVAGEDGEGRDQVGPSLGCGGGAGYGGEVVFRGYAIDVMGQGEGFGVEPGAGEFIF